MAERVSGSVLGAVIEGLVGAPARRCPTKGLAAVSRPVIGVTGLMEALAQTVHSLRVGDPLQEDLRWGR